MLWAVLYCETLGLGEHVDEHVDSPCTYIVTHQVHPVTATVFANVSVLFQQDTASYLIAEIDQEQFKKHDKDFKDSTFFRSQSHSVSVGCLGKRNQIHHTTLQSLLLTSQCLRDLVELTQYYG